MSTEYTFDGLNEWEKNLTQIIDRQYPEEFKQMVIDIAEQALGKAKELTPVQTGRLRDAWNLGAFSRCGSCNIQFFLDHMDRVIHIRQIIQVILNSRNFPSIL